MKNSAKFQLVLSVAVAASCPPVEAQPDAGDRQLSVGLKVWTAAWDSWITSPKGTGVALGTSRYQIVQTVSSDAEVAFIPVVSYRRKNLFVSMSAMSRTSYTLQDAAVPKAFAVPASRKELDVNIGYYLLPGLAATVGVKGLEQTYGTDAYRWHGGTIGLNGSAVIAQGLAIYGSGSVGRMRARFPAIQADAHGQRTFNASYAVNEVGLAYALPWRPLTVRYALVFVGHRAQFVKTHKFGLAVTDAHGVSRFNVSTDLSDTTRGYVVGAMVNF